VWPRLRKQIAVEREMLNQLIKDHRPLLEKCAESVPDRIELSALAAMLHGLYTGVENILKRVVIELDEGLPSGERWHRALLDRMTRPGPDRPPVISDALAESLTEYLAFRHFFRSAYPFVLQWEASRGVQTPVTGPVMAGRLGQMPSNPEIVRLPCGRRSHEESGVWCAGGLLDMVGGMRGRGQRPL